MPLLSDSRGRVGRGVAIVLLAAALNPLTAPPADAAQAAFCEQASTGPTYEWVADGPGAWNTPANWHRDGVDATDAPGYTETDALVCIPSDAEVTLVHNDDAPRGEAIVRTLDVAPDATLTIAPSGRLYTSGTEDDRSIVRRSAGGTPGLVRMRGTLGGIGEVHVDGLLDFEHLAGHGAPAMTTRHCITFVSQPCHPDAPPDTEPVSAPGVTVIGDRGLLRVVGANGVNLDDARVIDVHGRMHIVRPGYVAADDGTSIRIRAGATLALQGKANIFQGNPYFGQPRALVTLAGTVRRFGGDATSLVDARVQLGDKVRVRVKSGFLSLGGDVAPAGRVRYGASYGIGRCDDPGGTCLAPVASDSDPQVVSVDLPTGPTGTVPIRMAELPDEQKGGDVAAPVRLHVEDAVATAANPMRFRFLIDASVVDSRPAGSFDVKRRADKSAIYRTVPDCSGTGRPPKSWRACVASRSTVTGGDVRIVVRTQVSSRWKIR